MGVASVGNRYAVFGGSNGNGHTIEIFDGMENRWMFAKHNLTLGREQVKVFLSPSYSLPPSFSLSLFLSLSLSLSLSLLHTIL